MSTNKKCAVTPDTHDKPTYLTPKQQDIVRNRFILYKDSKKVKNINGNFIPAKNEDVYYSLLNIPEYRYESVDMKELYNDMLNLSKQMYVLPNDIDYKIYVLWIIATWKVRNFMTVPYLSFISPHNSGKTALLDGVVALSNKAILATTTPVVIPKLSNNIGAIPCIDEAHDLKESQPQLFTFLKSGYKRGSKYIKSKDNTDDDVVALNNFGFKVFAGESGFANTALNTRCITINPVIEGKPKIQKLSYVQDKLNEIRDKLLTFAINDSFKGDLGNDYQTLTGRIREIYEPLIVVAKHIGIPYDDIERHAMQTKNDNTRQRGDSVEYDVLELINTSLGTKIYKSKLIGELGWNTKGMDARRKAGARFGYQFTKKLNIPIKSRGFDNEYFDLTDKSTYERIKRHWTAYGIERKYSLKERKKQDEEQDLFL